MRRSLDRDQFHLEDERGVRPDVTTGALLTVSELGRDVELPLRSHRHKLQSLPPTGNGSFDLHGRGFPGPIGAVELGSINEGAPVIAYHRVGFRRFLSF